MKTFESWMKSVDQWVERIAGCSCDDLPDVCYLDLFEDGVCPKNAAVMAIRGEV